MKQFRITITIDEVLSESEIWPDGDGPKNPDTKDVRAAFFSGRYHRDILGIAKEWNLDHDADLDITEEQST